MPALTRAQIESSIAEAAEVFASFGLKLPPWAMDTTEVWDQRAGDPAWDQVRDCMLGWDVTDFGSGRFEEIGRVLFTVRNGRLNDSRYPKAFAQKYLFDPEHQRAPAHFHLSKNEDICCLAGGNILVELCKADDNNQRSDERFQVAVDGVYRELGPGDTVRLKPGMSVNIPPRTIHQFWGEEGTGLTISSEVSSVCDDVKDNFFLDPAERFPGITEDAERVHYLCNEYPRG